MTKLPRIVTNAEFEQLLKTEDRIEVIAVAFADGRIEQLPDSYYKHYQRMKQAFAVLVDEPVRRRAFKKIEELLGLQYHQVQKLLEDVHELFPTLETSNREFERMIMVGQLERLIDKVENGFGPHGIGGDVHSKSLPALYKLLADLKDVRPKPDRIEYGDLSLPVPTFSTDINDMPGYASAEEPVWEVIPTEAKNTP